MKSPFVKVADIYLPVNCLHYRRILIRPKAGNPYYLFVPCGKCYKCRKKQASDWAYRLGIESEGKHCYSLLITYADEHLPMHNGVPSLNRIHISECIKRLRYYLSEKYGAKVKFFVVGEYAPETKRPHYHGILFSSKSLHTKEFPLSYLDAKLESVCWEKGFANICNFKGEDKSTCVSKLVSYMTTYMTTGLSDDYNDKFLRPFRYMSRGLGNNFSEVHPEVFMRCCNTGDWTYSYKKKNGKTGTACYPRYYMKKYSTEFQRDARSEEYYTNCERFNKYLSDEKDTELIRHVQGYRGAYRKGYLDRLKALQVKERQYELEDYRERKVHKNNRRSTGLPKNYT